MKRKLTFGLFTIAYGIVINPLEILKWPTEGNMVQQDMDQKDPITDYMDPEIIDLLTNTFVVPARSFDRKKDLKPKMPKERFLPQGRKPVMWVHMHKAAGTFMCVCAGRAGENVVNPNDGTCNSKVLHDTFFPDGLLSSAQHNNCKDRTTYIRQNNFTWSQIEHEVSKGDFCKIDFIYGIMLRETISRLTSYVNWNTQKIHGYLYQQFLKCIENRDISICPTFPDATDNYNFGYREYDNFAVRTLGGYSTMQLPPGGVTVKHFDEAVSLLNQFDIILPLEQLDIEPFTSKMDASIGWHIQRNEKRARVNPHHIHFSSADVARFQAINKYDIALYNKFVAQT